jgi:tryptophan synthase beta chain
MKVSFQPDQNGYYGEFGGAYIPEMLYTPVQALKEAYRAYRNSSEFVSDFDYLLREFVGRPTPLFLAERLSELYGAEIFLKREDLCHTGSHKINNTIGQALLARFMGKHKIVAETGAGQHGVATATVCALMNMECMVFMGEVDILRQKPNVERMRILGAEVIAVKSGSRTLKDATNEAMRYWIANPLDTHYIIGSVVGPHPYPDMVAGFQSVISEEIKKQLLEKTGNENPDKVIACVGGGSNAAGAFYHFMDQPEVDLIGSEAGGLGVTSGKTAATLAAGTQGILHGSKTFLLQDHEGQITEPHSISAGLDYPGIGPLHAHLFSTSRCIYYPVTDQEAMEAGFLLSTLEGIIPAVESAHALAVLSKIKLVDSERVVICLSGRGDKDLETYISWKDTCKHKGIINANNQNL